MTSKQGTSDKKTDETSVSDPKKTEEASVSDPPMKKIRYPPDGKSEKILESLHAGRHDGELCDVRLKYSKSKTVYAHKSILATSSPYFKGMFTSAFMEASSDVIDLSHITDREDVLEKVIDTFYGRTFEINEDNISDTINLATMLLLDDLRSECTKVLFGLVHVRNAVEMLQISINFEIEELKEKALPILSSRFHDYILFQEDLFDLSVEGFEKLISNIDTSYIARSSKYVQFILKWFLICESDERAKLLKQATENIRFKVTKHAYSEFEDELEGIINHLDDANSDVSYEMKQELSEQLPRLKPIDYIKNPLSDPVQSSDEKIGIKVKNQGDSDSELEDEPTRELYLTSGAEQEVNGPPTKEKGFTDKEEAIWVKAHKDMAERDKHKIWAKKWPMDPFNKRGTHNDPNRPKRIKREASPDVYKSRNRCIKSEEKLAEEVNLVDAVVVLAPSNAYMKRMDSNETAKDNIDGMLDICAYIPRKRAWFKITSLSTTSMKKRFNQTGRYEQSDFVRRKSRPEDSDDEEEEEEDAFHSAAMMDMYEPEMLMMMRGMPSSRRRRLMEEAVHGRMQMSLRDEDFDRREYLMMREMSRMQRRHHEPFGMGMMLHMMRHSQTTIPPLTDPKWNAVYMKHCLYFYHQKLLDTVFCYDILNQNWHKSEIRYKSDTQEQSRIDVKDGIELIVLGQVLHAVLRIAVFDRRYENQFRSKAEKIERSKQQEVMIKHAVFKMKGDLGNAQWEKVMENAGHQEFIPIDKAFRIDPDEERHGYRDYYERGPKLRQPDSLKTILYAEDEEKLIVCCVVRKRYYKDESIVGYSITHIDAMYLDLKVGEHLGLEKQMFLRTLTPLFSDDLVGFFSDDLKNKVMLDSGSPCISVRVLGWGYGEPEKYSEYLDARNQYPRCPSVLFSEGDGKSLWILRGKDNDTSETLEVYATMCYHTRKCHLTTKRHPPPPFKCFTMAMAAKMDKTTVRTLGLPTQYLHAD